MTLLPTLALTLSDALACGGFFCDSAQPVDQAGERIVFAIDEAAGQIEMHVQVAYEGPASEFSWLLPVPTQPEVLLSTDDLFVRLGAATAPQFVPTRVEVGRCLQPIGRSFDLAVQDSGSTNGEFGGVTITSASQVGPYDVTVLTATDTATLTAWLDENGYDLPEGGEAKLGAYVSSGSYFVALKLQKDRDDGDLAPVALRFPGTEPIIPLQLTAVAVTSELPIQPFVLSRARAVPENYLHVVINELLVDWTLAGANYPSVLARAADEAGGQAFATDFAGELAPLGVQTWAPGQYDLDAVAAARDVSELSVLLSWPFVVLGDQSWQSLPGVPVTTGTLPILARYVEILPGMAPVDYFGCLGCYSDLRDDAVDGVGLAAALEAEWVKPMQEIQAMLDRSAWVTRMSSSMSAAEMTIDPRFVINPDLPATAVGDGATMEILCQGTHTAQNAPRRLVLEDGTFLDLPSSDQAAEIGFVWEEWVVGMGDLNALVVEQTGRSGDAVPVRDNRAAVADALSVLNRGCGCDGVGGGLGWLAAAGAVVARRRRS
jgi:hypothetical protein